MFIFPRLTDGARILISINIIIYLLDFLISNILKTVQLKILFGLIPSLVLDGYIWQLFTYQFLHAGVFHILFNMVALWMFGSELENEWGKKKFIRYYLVCGLGAGFLIFILPVLFGQGLNIPTIGASGAVFGLFLAYALYWPNREILVFFVIPVKIKYFVIIISIISLILTFEGNSSISHVGHLGGLITGYFYFHYYIHKREHTLRSIANNLKNKIQSRNSTKYQNIKSHINQGKVEWDIQNHSIEEIEKKVDILLDKISQKGINSLSKEERVYLKEASNIINNEG